MGIITIFPIVWLLSSKNALAKKPGKEPNAK
jgi:hypothetical protein